MPTLVITLKTLEPLLATSFKGDPNSDVSYEYIPGSMIRGALISRYLRWHRQHELDLGNDEVQRLFFSDQDTRYLNAYIVGNGIRMLPVPQSWRREKGASQTESVLRVCDFSIEGDEDDLVSPKGFTDGEFWYRKGSSVYGHRPERRVNIHNQRDRTKGRSSKKENNPDTEGAVFRYEALGAGQTFQSAILCTAQDGETLQILLENPDVKLGGSRSAGYGHAKLTMEEIADWQESNIAARGRAEEEGTTLTLLSHTLLRDEWGQPTADPNLLTEAINYTLGTEGLTAVSHIFSSSTLIGGFNRKWGLPLPQVPALAAGTVLVFEDETLTTAQIEQLELEGIGDRRNEGFGRVAVNIHSNRVFDLNKLESAKTTEIPTIEATDAINIANKMAERLLRQKLERQLKQALQKSKLKRSSDGSTTISNSQLSRLGTAARTGLKEMRLDAVSDLLNSLAPYAKDQFKSARLKRNNESLYEQLETWIEQPTIWMGSPSELTVSIGANVTRTIDAETAPTDDLAKEYTLRLIAAVAKQTYKESNSPGAITTEARS